MIFLGVIVLVLATGPLLQLFAAPRMHAAIAETYPPPGQILEVDGAKMHIYCEGQGSQTVIIVNSTNDQSLAWRDVQAKLAGNARVCIYDRLGRGWSAAASRERSAENIADEFNGLVKAAGIAPGFVLVGDQEGTIYASMFAWRHPGQAGALLLVNEINVPPEMYASTVIPISLVSLAMAPLQTFSWVLGGKDFIKSLKGDCLPWMDNNVCGFWRAWKADGYDTQTAFFEGYSIPAGLRSLFEPQVKYGNLPIVILSVAPGDCSTQLFGRSTNCRMQVFPGIKNYPLIDKSPQTIVDAVKVLLH